MNTRISVGLVVLSLSAVTACGASETAEQSSPATTVDVILNNPDAAYRQAVKDADIPMPMYDDVGLAQMGRTSCDVLDRSRSFVLLEAYKRTYIDLTAVQRAALLDAAISSFCPELAGS